MKTKEEKIVDNYSLNKIIEVRPVTRSSQIFDSPVAMFKGSVKSLDLPIDPARRSRVNIFKDEEEQEFFEKKFNLPPGSMSIYDRNNKFWNEYRVVIPDDGIVLNLNNISDLLKYKVLQANDHIVARSWNERNDDARFKFALVEEGSENIELNKTQDIKKKAYVFIGKIEDSVDKMIDVLNVFGKKIDRRKGVSIDFLKAELYKIVEDNTQVERLISIAEDKDFEYRVIIDKALSVKALYRIGKNGYKLPKGEEAIAEDTKEMIDWLKDQKNHLKVETIKAQIEIAK